MTHEQIAKMAHKLPRHETDSLFFFILGYLGDDMPDCIKKEIANRYMRHHGKGVTGMMQPEIGLYVRDKNLNLYRILDCRNTSNTHTQRPYEWLVECLKGPNTGRTMWIRDALLTSGEFPISEKESV